MLTRSLRLTPSLLVRRIKMICQKYGGIFILVIATSTLGGCYYSTGLYSGHHGYRYGGDHGYRGHYGYRYGNHHGYRSHYGYRYGGHRSYRYGGYHGGHHRGHR